MIWFIVAAFALDLLMGDPQGIWHPVRFMGWVIERLHPLVEGEWQSAEPQGREGKSEERQVEGGKKQSEECQNNVRLSASRTQLKKIGLRLRGALYPLVLCVISVVFAFGIALLPSPLREMAIIYVLYSSLAARSLAVEVLKVLRVNDIADKRAALSMLCSRDTADMDERGINSTLFETTSENSVDGVLAPLCYMLAAAAVGNGFFWKTVLVISAALIYKSVSTCDSMVGYKNERFIDTGMISARLDDILNFLPARLSQFFILIAGFGVVALRNGVAAALASVVRGVRVYFRDRKKHESPNSCHPMAMFAGILGVRICGPASYFGKIKAKEYVGDDERALTGAVVAEAVAVMLLSAVLMLLFGVLFAQ